ncbi:MAG: glycerol-3-phosphate dehydrogenase/oxidase [Steroidobacter sp.]
MHRNTKALSEGEFDILIIGAGAFGAAAARDAALRGLRTALIERADFGGGTSAECFKMVHGGIRYLQHADIPRLRASCHERSALLRIAPHLVHPLPIAIPTYGYGQSGKAFLGAGACAYDLLTMGRNAGISDPERRVGRTRFLSRAEVLALFPHLRARALTGAVVFEDGQMYNPARLVLAFVKGAVAAGATACNYLEAQSFLWEGDAVRGVRVRDQLNGECFDVRARLTLNAAGPWADYLQQDPERFGTQQRAPFSRDAYFIVDRPPTSPYGVAVQGLSRDKDALLGRATRHLFAAPWRDKTLLGVWHRLFPDSPDAACIEPDEIEQWLFELNAVYPELSLSSSEVTFANFGLVPFGDTATESELSFGKESRLIDHRSVHGVHGLVSLVGIRFTTARADAGRALDLLLQQSPLRAASVATDRLPLPGGDIDDFQAFQIRAHCAEIAIDSHALDALLRNHGAEYWQVLDCANGARASRIAGTTTLCAELWHAVDREMAMHLEDVVMRRTDLAAGAHPGRPALEEAATLMGERLAWSTRRIRDEIVATERTLARHLARPGAARSDGAMLANGPANSTGGKSEHSVVDLAERRSVQIRA